MLILSSPCQESRAEVRSTCFCPCQTVRLVLLIRSSQLHDSGIANQQVQTLGGQYSAPILARSVAIANLQRLQVPVDGSKQEISLSLPYIRGSDRYQRLSPVDGVWEPKWLQNGSNLLRSS